MINACITTRLTMIVSFIIPGLFFFGCAPDKPDRSNFENAAAVAEDIAVDSLVPLIYRLEKARMNATPVNCEGFESNNMFPACALTRDSAVAIVTDALEAMGYTVDTIVAGEEPMVTYSIVAEWRGVSKPQEVVLLSGHPDGFYSGADDNGSALAVMLETARAVRHHRFARTIRFASFDLEEFGSVGSTRYIKDGYANDIVSGIVMDCVGYASGEKGSQKQIPGLQLPDKGNFLLCAGNENSLEITRQFTALSSTFKLTALTSVVVPGDGAFFFSNAFLRSDHGLLWYKGFPILFLTDTANFRNPHYHQKTDTPETINKEFLAANTRAVAAMIALMAEVLP